MRQESGFTIVEVLVAVLILSVGLLALASTAALVTRMIGQGDRFTEAATMASRRLETLRSQTCANMSDGSSTSGRYTMTWRVVSVVGGKGRQITITVVSPTYKSTRTDTFVNTIVC